MSRAVRIRAPGRPERLERDASGRRAVAMASDHDAVPTAVRNQWADAKHHSSPYRFICVLGGPGSGRGTHCRRLERELGAAHFSTGALLRQAVETNHPAAGNIEGAMAAGEPVADPVVFGLLQSAFKQAVRDDPQRVILLDGFPRDSAQTRWMQHTLGEPELVVFLDCPHSVMVERVTSRDTRKDPSRSDSRSSAEMYRADNTEAAAHTLIHRFNVDTLPIMDVFGTKVQILQSEGTIEQTYQDVLVCVGGRIKKTDGLGSPVTQKVNEVVSPIVREAVAGAAAASPSKDDATAAAECAKAALDELIKLPPEHVAPLLIKFVDSADAFLASQAETVAEHPPLQEQQLPSQEQEEQPGHEHLLHTQSATKIQAQWRGKRAREQLADEMRLARARASMELANSRAERFEQQEQENLQKERDELERLEQKRRAKAVEADKLNSVLKAAGDGLERFLPAFLKASIGVERMLDWDREKMARKLGITRVGLSTLDIEALVKAMVHMGYHPVAAASYGYATVDPDPEPEPQPQPQPHEASTAGSPMDGDSGRDSLSSEEWERKLCDLLQEQSLQIVRTGDSYHGLKLFRLNKEVSYMCVDTQQLTTSMLVAVEIATDQLLSNAGYAARVGGRGGDGSKRSPSTSATGAGQLRKKYNGIPEVPPEDGGIFEAHFVAEGKLGLSFNGARNVVTGNLQIVVTQNKATGSMAAAAAHIEPRDILQSVQGESVKDRRLPDVINMIVATGRPLTLTFLRPAPGIEARMKREEERQSQKHEDYEKRMRAAQHEIAFAGSPGSSTATGKPSVATAPWERRQNGGGGNGGALSSPQREAKEAERIKHEREAKVNQILGVGVGVGDAAAHGQGSPATGSGNATDGKRRRRRRPADQGSPMRHRTVQQQQQPSLSLAERSMASARKKKELADARATPSGDVWGPPPGSSLTPMSVQGTGTGGPKQRTIPPNGKLRGGPLPQPTRGGTPSMMRGGFRQQSGKSKGGKSVKNRFAAPPTLVIKRGPLPQPVRGGTPSMMRGGFRKLADNNAVARKQHKQQKQQPPPQQQQGQEEVGPVESGGDTAAAVVAVSMEQQLADNNAELDMLASQLQSLPEPVWDGAAADNGGAPTAAEQQLQQLQQPRAASVPPDVGSSSGGAAADMMGGGEQAVHASVAAEDIFSTQIATAPAAAAADPEVMVAAQQQQQQQQSLEQVESQLFAKLETLSG